MFLKVIKVQTQAHNVPLLLYCPLGHAATQPIELKLTKRPVPHDMHAVAAGAEEYLPAGQAAQTNALLTYCPASQLVSSNTTLADSKQAVHFKQTMIEYQQFKIQRAHSTSNSEIIEDKNHQRQSEAYLENNDAMTQRTNLSESSRPSH